MYMSHKVPFTHAIFGVILVALFNAIFVAPEFTMKIASVNWKQFLCDLSTRYHRGKSCNFVGGNLGKI